MFFEWNDVKNKHNIQKHHISFVEAVGVFFDPFCLRKIDTRFSDIDYEERWQALGTVNGVTVILIAYTHRDSDNEEVIRIISARKANKLEKRAYEHSKTRGY